ncbi:hypothetical protein ACHAXR_008697 [Thalassiosira sp. AJA248-18]
MNVMPMPSQIIALASNFHKLSILLFGYFIPALSSVKAVVRKDVEAYHQWVTYWLILHLYITIFSPILHLTLHPIFQILAILWLSLPQYQGASVVYERIVTPWVDQYESKVDDAVEEAHRGVRRWIWSRLGRVTWLLIGEGGTLADGIIRVCMGFLGGDALQSGKSEDLTIQPSNSTESFSLPPRHSVKEALSQSSSMEEVEEFGDSFYPTDEFVRDFVSMLQQGLYVFANVDSTDEVAGSDADAKKERPKHIFEEGFKLGIFSLESSGAFLISPVAAGANELAVKGSTPVRLPLDNLKPLRVTGTQGLILECHGNTNVDKENFACNVRAEIVLSDESDRDILLTGLNACLPRFDTYNIMQEG